ncbi:Inner membrane protein ybaN [Phocoenobacter uteri]|uniref:Inner membrane protein n=1 Tax=Phocoenobacter uteri TaxID=146806 RepID=A0A379C8M5_9PAST|nr:YbaN family protein [Phocoenobacter uteri]MDG6882320.1 hypothetical protein [Phocoenobacter uteri]SUB58478.1 Inner membrane protein ybaN [Phocoenobacter uteri]
MTKYNIKRILFFVSGWICVALGVIGAILPLMPTTPFVLLALFCFSRSSERFHSWLFNHRILGKPIRDWQENKTIPTYAKVMMTVMITFSCGMLAYKFL